MTRLLFAAAVAALAPQAFADIPVHCLRHEVVGKWRFVLGAPGASRSGCSHSRPDKEEAQPARALIQKASEVTVLLSDPNTATIEGKEGTWTMVYDEGFEVNVGGRSFFAFSNFTFDSEKHNVSHCDETMVGWYSNENRTAFGCYYGEKLTKEKTKVALLSKSSTSTRIKESSRYDAALTHETQTQHVQRLNRKLSMMQIGWRARVMPKWNGRSFREINGYAGIARRSSQLPRSVGRVTEPMKKLSFLQQKNKMPDNMKVPQTFTWADVNGMDYTEPVMDQGECGSCYDASTMRMLTARHKINLNNSEAIPWSINFPLFCSEYNQGCKGGFGFLTTKWSSDVGLIPATCMRYNTAGSCKLECDLKKELAGQKRYRAANHRYVNQYYGNFNTPVQSIMSELYRNGPIVLSFEPSEDFMFYSDGIYLTPKDKLPLGGRKHVEYDKEWERVDHAVVGIGYGIENGTKYWLIMNSWGGDWGEDGLFRMALGMDESGVESSPEAADVVEDEQEGRQVEALFAENALLAKA